MTLGAILGATLFLGACTTTERAIPAVGTAHVVSDFDSYKIHRVGVVPIGGAELDPERAAVLQGALHAEFSSATRYEVVLLDAADLAEIPMLDAHRDGRYRGRTIMAIARRFRLDAMLIATVTDEQVFPPQRLSVQADLVSSETGQTLWAASVNVDASRSDVRRSLEAWAKQHVGDLNESGWELVLISPRRFARFAANQLARLAR